MFPLLCLISAIPILMSSSLLCGGGEKPEDSHKPYATAKSTAPVRPPSNKKPSSKSSKSRSGCKTENSKTPKSNNANKKSKVQKSLGKDNEESKQSGKVLQKEEKQKKSKKGSESSGVVRSKNGDMERGGSDKMVRSQKAVETMAAIWDHDFGDEKPESSNN